MTEQVEFPQKFRIEDNKTFNKLCQIQKLIKKESALKKICKQKFF